MIKINLLPHKKVKPMEAGVLKLWIALGALSVILLAGAGIMWIVQVSEMSELKDSKVRMEKELEQLNKDVKLVDQFEADRKVLEQKLVIIGELTKQRVPLTKLFNELNKFTDMDDIWFESMVFKDSSFTVECFGRSDKSVDKYFKSLEGSGVFSGLQRSSIREVPNKLRKGQTIYQTVIQGKLAGYEDIGKPLPKLDEPKAKKDDKGKKGKKGKKGGSKKKKKK